MSARRLALVLEYDGGRHAGSQLQTHTPTIQQALETALHDLTGERLRVAFAGRTDAGVHARGQVAAFTTASRLAASTFVRGLNAHLPDQIAVRNAVEVDPDFDPRRHATSRTYRYLIYNQATRSPLWRERAWHIAQPLDEGAMAEAAALLAGEHDFAAFSRNEGVRTVRCVSRSEIARRGNLVAIEVEANAFLRQQMRRTAGALAQVGLGKGTVAGFGRLLREAEPASAGPLAPARGLYLLRVSYGSLDLGAKTRYDTEAGRRVRRP